MSARAEKLREMEASVRRIGCLVGSGLPAGVGFALFLYEYGAGGWSTYVSNCDRATMIAALEEQLLLLRGQVDRPHGAAHPESKT